MSQFVGKFIVNVEVQSIKTTTVSYSSISFFFEGFWREEKQHQQQSK